MSENFALEQKILNKINIAEELEEAFFDIPFGNSQFQIRNFIVNASLTPARAYRAVGLEIMKKVQALRETYFTLQKGNIDIEELEERIADPKVSAYDKRRARLDIEQKLAGRGYTRKLVQDALAELDCLYKTYKQLPRFTRAEFEAAEGKYFDLKLRRQARGITGAMESIENMRVDLISGLDAPRNSAPLIGGEK